jgi:hypothetical protein
MAGYALIVYHYFGAPAGSVPVPAASAFVWIAVLLDRRRSHAESAMIAELVAISLKRGMRTGGAAGVDGCDFRSEIIYDL